MTLSSRMLHQPRKKYFVVYCLGAALVAALGSLALLSVVYFIITAANGAEPTGPEYSLGWVEFFGIAVFSPLIETALLVVMLRLLSRLPLQPLTLAALAAILWGCFHGLLFPMWFFGTVWSFFIFSCAYLTWRTHSEKLGYWAAALPHAILNTVVFFAMASGIVD